MTFRLTFAPLRLFCLPSGGTVDEPCYDDPPAAVESNDSAAAEEVQVFPDYDAADPEPVYD